MKAKTTLTPGGASKLIATLEARCADLVAELGPTKRRNAELFAQLDALERQKDGPIPMRLACPTCHKLHIDAGEFTTKPHHTHACQHCGMVWRPAIVPTVGVRFLPGFKDEVPAFLSNGEFIITTNRDKD